MNWVCPVDSVLQKEAYDVDIGHFITSMTATPFSCNVNISIES